MLNELTKQLTKYEIKVITESKCLFFTILPHRQLRSLSSQF